MLISQLGSQKNLNKLLDILANPDQLRSELSKLVEQESKVKALTNELCEAQSVDDFCKIEMTKLEAFKKEIETANQEHLILESKLKSKERQLNERAEMLQNEIDQFESYKSEHEILIKNVQAEIDLKHLQVNELLEQTGVELKDAYQLKTEYETKLKQIEDSVAALKA